MAAPLRQAQGPNDHYDPEIQAIQQMLRNGAHAAAPMAVQAATAASLSSVAACCPAAGASSAVVCQAVQGDLTTYSVRCVDRTVRSQDCYEYIGGSLRTISSIFEAIRGLFG